MEISEVIGIGMTVQPHNPDAKLALPVSGLETSSHTSGSGLSTFHCRSRRWRMAPWWVGIRGISRMGACMRVPSRASWCRMVAGGPLVQARHGLFLLPSGQPSARSLWTAGSF